MTVSLTPERPLHERVDEWLRAISDDDEIFRLLELSFGRVILNRKIEDFEKFKREVDIGRRWFKRAIELKSEWLNRLDDLGRPKKLMKFSDIAGIGKEIQKANVKEAQHFAQIVVTESDET